MLCKKPFQVSNTNDEYFCSDLFRMILIIIKLLLLVLIKLIFDFWSDIFCNRINGHGTLLNELNKHALFLSISIQFSSFAWNLNLVFILWKSCQREKKTVFEDFEVPKIRKLKTNLYIYLISESHIKLHAQLIKSLKSNQCSHSQHIKINAFEETTLHRPQMNTLLILGTHFRNMCWIILAVDFIACKIDMANWCDTSRHVI